MAEVFGKPPKALDKTTKIVYNSQSQTDDKHYDSFNTAHYGGAEIMPDKRRSRVMGVIIAMAVVTLLMIASILLFFHKIVYNTQEASIRISADQALKRVLKDQIDSELDEGTIVKIRDRYFVYENGELTYVGDSVDTLKTIAIAGVFKNKVVFYLSDADSRAVMYKDTDVIQYNKLIDPDEKSTPTYTYSQVNKAVGNYLKNVSYHMVADSVSKITQYLDTPFRSDVPAGCTVELEAGVLTVLDNGTGNVYRVTVEKGPYTFYNLTPGVGGEFYVMSGDTVVQRGHLRPTGALRMIWTDTPGLGNIRDLGGWPCDGGTVKYNLLFRGAMVIDATDEDRETWVKMLGIKHDVFLKTYDDSLLVGREEYRKKSPLGDQVSLYQMDLSVPGSENKQGIQDAKDEMRGIMNRIFDNAIAGEATYFHCLQGADRTGMVAVILEGVLGMSRSDIDRDYELTSFSALRTRNGEIYLADINALNEYTGKTFRDKCILYLMDCGIPLTKINEFRAAVIDGDPEYLTENALFIEPTGTNLSEPFGDGWIEGGRCSSGGDDRFDVEGYTLTNYFPVQKGDVVYVRNLAISNTVYSGIYKAGKKPIAGFAMSSAGGKGYVKGITTMGDWEVFTVVHDQAEYMRLCGKLLTNEKDVVIHIYRDGEWLYIGE
jgi:hypothetical protein